MKKYYEGLAEALAENQLVILYRKAISEHKLNGYVIGLSNTWVLLQAVDNDMLMLDGYNAVRLGDVSHFTVDDSFVGEYLRLRGIHSEKLPEVNVSDLFSLLQAVSEHFPLFMIERECVEPGIGIVGQVERLTKRSLRMDKFSSKAKWIGTEKFKLKDITSVNFGDHYHEALAFMDAHRKETESQL